MFDEIISFRVGYHGAQGRLGITPDLTTLGKIIGGGLPVGAVGGREDVMALFDPRADGRIAHGGTFNANPMTVAAGLATLHEMTPARYEQLEALGAELRDKLEELGVADVRQTASLFQVDLGDDQKQLELHLALLADGIFFTQRGMGCLSTPMTSAEIDAFVEAVRLAVR